MFTDIYNAVLPGIFNFIEMSLAEISAYVAAPLATALLLYVVLYGISILRGSIQEPLMDFAIRTLKLAIIVILVRDMAQYNSFVTQVFFVDLPQQLGSAYGGERGAGPIDTMFNRGVEAAHKAYNDGSWGSGSFAWALIMTAVSLSAALAFAYTLFSKLAMAIVLSIGPVFIALALFDSTRRWFWGWLTQLVNFLLIFVVVIAIGALSNSIIEAVRASTQGTGYEVLLQAFYMAAAIAVCAFLYTQAPAIAAGIAAGGGGGSAEGMTRELSYRGEQLARWAMGGRGRTASPSSPQRGGSIRRAG